MQKGLRVAVPISENFATMDGFCERRMRMILIGKTGAGKSATGNTILGGDVFKSQVGVNSETKECGVAVTKRGGQEILVMDTPGLCDTDGEDSIIAQRITQSLFAVAPGPHAIILVLRCDARFTEAEVKVYNMLKHVFGENMTSYMIVIFVGKDELERKNITFESQLARSQKLQGVLQEADNRYLLFNNEGDVHEKALMVGRLMQMVKDVVAQNGGNCFRHRISSEVDETMNRMVQEEIRQRTGDSLLPVIDEDSEYCRNKPKARRKAPPPPKPTRTTSAGTQPSGVAPQKPQEEGVEANTDDVPAAELEAFNRRQEIRNLGNRQTVKARLQQFAEPAGSRGASPAHDSSTTQLREPDKKYPGGTAHTQTPPPELLRESDQEDAAEDDVVCNWRSDDAHVEEVLDRLQEQLVLELASHEEDSAFVYEVPDRPGMSLAQKQRLVEDALRRKIVSCPEDLSPAQKAEMDKAVTTVGQKIREGMSKFAVKALNQCAVM